MISRLSKMPIVENFCRWLKNRIVNNIAGNVRLVCEGAQMVYCLFK